jgi:chromosome partitioning protein
MYSWAYVNLKPGVGKTTSSVFHAHALHAEGLEVLFVDADPGGSALRWADMAGGFPFPIIGLPSSRLDAELRNHIAGKDAVVLDLPQLEDHAKIANSGLRFAQTWVAPVAPSGIEVDRMSRVSEDFFANVQAALGEDNAADEVVLLNRTNVAHQTKNGPDNAVRDALTERGYHVLATQIPYNDGLYRQCFGVPVEVEGTGFVKLTTELLDRARAREHAA